MHTNIKDRLAKKMRKSTKAKKKRNKICKYFCCQYLKKKNLQIVNLKTEKMTDRQPTNVRLPKHNCKRNSLYMRSVLFSLIPFLPFKKCIYTVVVVINITTTTTNNISSLLSLMNALQQHSRQERI